MDPMKPDEVTAQEQTAQAERETKHLQKTLGRLDIVFLIVAAVVSIEVLAQVSGFGGADLHLGSWFSPCSFWCRTG